MSFDTDGYVLIPNILTISEISHYRKILDKYLSSNPTLQINESKIIPGWSGITPELEDLNNLHQDKRLLLEIAKIYKDRSFKFLGHSDLHQNKDSNWHRDIHDMSRGGCNLNIWDDDCLILKVCFLLQDHTDNDLGLWFESGTHKSEHAKNKPIHIYSKSVDMIIFDQRIKHRGQINKPFYHEIYNQNRYLLTFGYGLDNNPYSNFHEIGSAKRQNTQRKSMTHSNLKNENKYKVPSYHKKTSWVVNHYKYINDMNNKLTDYQKTTDSELTNISIKYSDSTDKGPHSDYAIKHNYTEIYDKLLRPYKNQQTSLIEIGVRGGGSLLMWEEFLGNAQIYGIDINRITNPNVLNCDNIQTFTFDAYNPDKVAQYLPNHKFDIIIDDGSHIMKDQIKMLNLWHNKLKDNGILIIEDILNIKNAKNIIANFIGPINRCSIIDRTHCVPSLDDINIVYFA